MDQLLGAASADEESPDSANKRYERLEILGRGSFGEVWLARRVVPPQFADDDEYVALKNIEIKDEKSRIYAHREISILSELDHPNIIRLIRAYPVYKESFRLIAIRLARGPNLQHLMVHRGALGTALSRLVARHLVAGVSYLHGRAVLHRDIKPNNCILENTQLHPQHVYHWQSDHAIWSDGPDCEEAVAQNKWKLVLVDFGFARALTQTEISSQKKPMKQSIVREADDSLSVSEVAQLVATELKLESSTNEHTGRLRRASMKHLRQEHPAMAMSKRRLTSVSLSINEHTATPEEPPSPRSFRRPVLKRQSTARTKLRAMSALGTKAYAAPEIKNELRNKTDSDRAYEHQAITNCVADYGMIVDAYSVGWTLRVIMTGVPPTVTFSEFETRLIEAQNQIDLGCFCFRATNNKQGPPDIRIHDICDLPKLAANLIGHLTKENADERMTVREAQNHPWILGDEAEPYQLPEGDIPSKPGDPVVPLKCAGSIPD